MISEIVDVVRKIAEGIKAKDSFETTLKSLSREKKYDKKMVAAAFSWIFEKMTYNSNENQFSINEKSKGFRILSEEEYNLVGLENYNYLLNFYNLGLLNKTDIDTILASLELFSLTDINTDVLNVLILSQLVNTGSNSLPGSRFTLYHSDTIN